jgi:hypothetical protein
LRVLAARDCLESANSRVPQPASANAPQFWLLSTKEVSDV